MLNENRLIKDNIKNFRLLTESVDHKSITDAIENRKIVKIYYQGDNTVNRGYRTIEPYAYGTHKTTDNYLLRAWEQAGASDSKNHEPKAEPDPKQYGWRLFNVSGISSWMPVLGKNSTFKESVTPRPKFNPNDEALNVISAYSDNAIDTNKTTGQGSVEEPNVITKDTSAFDKQTTGFKDFGKDSNNFQYKKNITNLYGNLKFSRKQKPSNHIVILDSEGNMDVKPKWYQSKYDPKNILGNLDTLFRDISNIDTNRITRSDFENFQNQLNNSSSLLGNTRSKNIDRSFFDKKYDDFEKSLQNN